MAGDFLAAHLFAHWVTFGDFMAGDVLAADYLDEYPQTHLIRLPAIPEKKCNRGTM